MRFRPAFDLQEMERRIAPSGSAIVSLHGNTVKINVRGDNTQFFAYVNSDNRLEIDYGNQTALFDLSAVKTIVWNVHGNSNYGENDTNVVNTKIHVHGNDNNFIGSLEKDTGFMKGSGNTAFGGDAYDNIVIITK